MYSGENRKKSRDLIEAFQQLIIQEYDNFKSPRAVRGNLLAIEI